METFEYIQATSSPLSVTKGRAKILPVSDARISSIFLYEGCHLRRTDQIARGVMQ